MSEVKKMRPPADYRYDSPEVVYWRCRFGHVWQDSIQ